MPGSPKAQWLKVQRAELQRLFGRRVHELREAAKLTQGQLAEKLADVIFGADSAEVGGALTQQKFISELERGLRPVSLEAITALAEALKVDPLSILEPVFSRAPRDAVAVERDRREQFNRRLDEIYEKARTAYLQAIEGPLGTRAMRAISEVGAEWPADLETAVVMLEGLKDRRTATFVQGAGLAPSLMGALLATVREVQLRSAVVEEERPS